MKREQSKSQQRYEQLYLRWKDSGKGVRVFCEQESIKYSTFRYWIKRLEPRSASKQDFIEMKLDKIEVKSCLPLAELRLAEKGTLIFYELPESAWVKALLSEPMLSLSSSIRYFLYSQPVDMRCGFYSLAGLVQNGLKLDPLSGDVFVFIGKRANQVRLLQWTEMVTRFIQNAWK